MYPIIANEPSGTSLPLGYVEYVFGMHLMSWDVNLKSGATLASAEDPLDVL